MQSLMRTVFLVYVVLLTLLLLLAHPLRLVGMHDQGAGSLRALMPVAHFLSFLLLATLTLLANWPLATLGDGLAADLLRCSHRIGATFLPPAYAGLERLACWTWRAFSSAWPSVG